MSDAFHILDGELDPRARRYVRPVAVVWKSGEVHNDAALLTGQGPGCIMKGGATPASLLLDFGKELHGGIALNNGIVPVQAPVKVRIRFGESVAEAMGDPNQDHAIHDQEVLIPWYGTTEFGNTGFRFVRIDLAEPGAVLDIKFLHAVFLFRDIEYKGSFRSSDALLNRIWDVGAYTVHLCMQDHLWDGIKRDRLVWIGDMHPETMVINTVFGENEVVPKSLDFVRDNTPLPGWMNGISSYSLWWILVHDCWYQYHGNRDYLESQRGYLVSLLKLLCGQLGENHREQLGETRFLDWPSSEDKAAIHAGLHALLHLALKNGAALCDVLGESGTAAECRTTADRMRAYKPPHSPSKQANALLALSGLADAAEINESVLARDPLRGVSTFYGYYVLQARAQAADHSGALEVIRRYWGAMLDLGATTFWEDFNLDWVAGSVPVDKLVPEGQKSIHADYGDYCYKGLRHSLCHGWAAGPTAWMSEHLLGVQPLAPGFKRVRIAPRLEGLDFVEGVFPTPHGMLHIRAEKGTESRPKVEYEAPAGIEVVTT